MKHIVIAALCLMAGTASAAEIKVISGGAVEPGLEAFAQLVRRDLGHELKILYNTAPQIAKRLAAGEVFDILISPPATIEPALKEGKVVPETRVKVGRVGAGIIVRTGAPAPDVATVDALKTGPARRRLRRVQHRVNRDLSRQTLRKDGHRRGPEGQDNPLPDRRRGHGAYHQGQGQRDRIRRHDRDPDVRTQGAETRGTVAAAVQNYTNYEAVLMTGAIAAEAGRAVLRLLATAAAKAAFASGGVE